MIQTDDYEVKQVVMTEPMMRIRQIRANETYLLASRGSFKTTQGIPFYLVDCVLEMPGATGIIVGPSFEHLLDNTLNPCFNSLQKNGFIEGVHFVVGTPPPKNWAKPLLKVPAKKFDHIVSWYNGSMQHIVSMQKKGSTNGISCQYGVFDEAKFLNKQDLEDIVFPSFRGNEQFFGHHSLYLSKFFATDKLADYERIKWLLDKEKLNNYDKFDIIAKLQMELDRLHLEYNQSGINKRDKLKPQIHAIETRLNLLRKTTSLYIESNAMDSVKILGNDWLEDKKKNSTSYVWKVAYMNENPDRPQDVFYPDFDKNIHTHTLETDYDPNSPLIIAFDYQYSVSPALVAQIGRMPEYPGKLLLKYVGAVSTLPPDGLEEAVQLFCYTYRTHKAKTIYYVYDQTATGKRVNALEYYKIVISCLRKNGWNVIEIHTGRQPGHYDKFIDTKAWLKEERKNVPAIIMHRNRCADAVISIERTGVRTNTKGLTEKDKRQEDTKTYPNLDQRHTTHFSDVFDMINHAVLKMNRITNNSMGAGSIAFR